MGYHECWAIINSSTGRVVIFDNHYCVYSEEGAAWETCLKVRAANPERSYTVKKTKLMLPWHRR